MATKTYIVAENWGKGFITHQDNASFSPSGFPANVWPVPANNRDANLWIAKVLGTVKTRAEAQALVDAEITAENDSRRIVIKKNGTVVIDEKKIISEKQEEVRLENDNIYE